MERKLRAWIEGLKARRNKWVIVTKEMCLALAKKRDSRLDNLKHHQFQNWWLAEINHRFGQRVENFFLEWLALVVEALGEKEKVPIPPHHLMAMWIRDAWELISEVDMKAATEVAYFRDGLAICQVVGMFWRRLL